MKPKVPQIGSKLHKISWLPLSSTSLATYSFQGITCYSAPAKKKAATWPHWMFEGSRHEFWTSRFPVTDPWNGSMKIPIPISIDIYSHNIHSHNWGLDFDLLNPFQSLHDLRLPDAFACTWLWTLILGDRRGFRFFQDGSDPLGDGVFVFRITTIFKSCPYTDKNTLLGICLESVLN